MPYKDPIKRKQYQADYQRKHYKYDGRSPARRKADPVSWIYWGTKSRAKEKGIEFTIDKSDIPIPEFCPILGIKLQVGSDSGKSSSPSIDRIDPAKGYVKGNVRIISMRANSIKSDATVEVLQRLIDYIEGRI